MCCVIQVDSKTLAVNSVCACVHAPLSFDIMFIFSHALPGIYYTNFVSHSHHTVMQSLYYNFAIV